MLSPALLWRLANRPLAALAAVLSWPAETTALEPLGVRVRRLLTVGCDLASSPPPRSLPAHPRVADSSLRHHSVRLGRGQPSRHSIGRFQLAAAVDPAHPMRS